MNFRVIPCLGLTLAFFTSLAHGQNNTAAARSLLLDAEYCGHTIFAVGERGSIIRTSDGAHTWEPISSPARDTLTAITFIGEQLGWAVGHDGLILHTEDGGETWTEQFHTENRETSFLDVIALSPKHVIALGSFGTCYETRDGGKIWAPRKLTDEDNHLNRITRGPDDTLLIAGERGTLLTLSPKAGSQPHKITSPYEGSFYGILPIGEAKLIAYGLRGHIMRSENQGKTWTSIASEQQSQLFTGLRLKNGTIILAGHNGRAFLLSHDEGHSFSLWPTPITMSVAHLLETPNGDLLVLGDAGFALITPPAPPAAAATIDPTSILPNID